jgi:translation initiation factor 6
MEFQKVSIHKNPFIGLYFKASERYLLSPRTMDQAIVENFCKTLQVEPISVLINQSNLMGVFAAMNSNGCILPEFSEMPEEKALKEKGLNIMKIKHYSPGNNILCNDKAVLINPHIHKTTCKEIGDTLGVEVLQYQIAKTNPIGLVNFVTNTGLLANNNAKQEEVAKFKGFFKVKNAGNATANLGSHVGISIVANSKGAMVGDLTSGIEMQKIYEILSNE